MSIIAELFTVARVASDKVTPASAFSESVTEHIWTVPAGEKWRIMTWTGKPNASGTMSVSLQDAAGNQVQIILSEAAGTAAKSWPQNGVAGSIGPVYILGEGEKLRTVFGVSQGAGAYVHLRYEVVNV